MIKGRLLKVTFLMSLGYLMACSPVRFTQNTSCGSFGNQECQVTPVENGGVRHFDNTINIGPAKADILFIDDNSGSMSVEQAKMGEKFPNFISSLGNVDYRIAITTTDVSTSTNPPSAMNDHGNLQDGRFIEFGNGASVLEPDMTDIAGLFETAIKRPETLTCENNNFASNFCPSPDERGIFAANLAIDRDHENFFRPGAHLAIVILSDEDERSKSGSISGFELTKGDLPETLIENVKSTFGKDKSFAVHTVIVRPGDTDCLNQQNSQTSVKGFEGHVYEELATLTGGRTGSICATDYGAEMGEIGTAVVDAVNSLELACRPINDEIDVIVTPSVAGLEFEHDKSDAKIRFNQTLPANTSVRLVYDCPKN